MDGASGTTSTAQSHLRVEIMPRIVVRSELEPTTNDPAIEVIATKTLSSGVEIIIYTPSAK